MCACVVCACGVVGVDETKAFAVFRPCWLEGLSKVCLCFGLFCLFGMLLGVWGNTGLLFYRITPLYRQDLLGGTFFGFHFWWVLFVGVVCCVRTV